MSKFVENWMTAFLLMVICICIMILEIVALMNGINGTQFTLVIIVLAAIGGVSIDGVVNIVKQRKIQDH